MKLNNRGRVTGGEPNPVDKYIGEQMRRRRVILKLSQGNLAKALGVTFQQVQKYETGMNRISASRMFDLCQVLGVEPNYFFNGMDSEIIRQSPRMLQQREQQQPEQLEIIKNDPLYQPRSMDLLAAYYRLPLKLQNLFYELIYNAKPGCPKAGE